MDRDILKFIEGYQGVKLTTYQKLYLKALMSKENIIMNVRRPCKRLIHNSMIEYNKAIKNDFCIVTHEGIEEYKGGELVDVKKHDM